MNRAREAAMALHTADDRTKPAIAAAGALVAAAILAGCVQQREPPAPGQTARTEPGMGFFLTSTDDEGAKLTYGRANSDDVWLMLQCRPGSRKVDIFDARHPGARKGDMLTLTSGRVQSALAPTLEPNPAINDGVVVRAQVTTDLPALDGFRQTGAVAVKLGSREYALSASAGEKAQIARFFSACERN
jgi:hypothetical protein